MDAVIYQPRRDLRSKIRRRVVRRQATRPRALGHEHPVVSITFDDVPVSVLEHALPELDARGWRSTLYVATGLMGATNHLGTMMEPDHIREAMARGHEIGAHTHSHRDFAQLSLDAQLADLEQSHAAFAEMGVPAPRSFAWPYGECTRAGKRLAARRYSSLRGIAPRLHRRMVDLNEVGSVPLFTERLAPVRDAVDALQAEPGWLTLFTHDVRVVPSAWGIRPDELARVLDWIAETGAEVLPVGEVVERIEASA